MNLYETVYNVLIGNTYTEEDAKALEAFLDLSESEIEKHIESTDASILEDIASLSEEDIKIFEEDEEDEDIEEVAKGQRSKRGAAAATVGGAAAGLAIAGGILPGALAGGAIYLLYKAIKSKAEKARTKCDRLSGIDKKKCMFDVREKELGAKKAAIKKAASKEKNPEKKKKVMAKAAKEVKKIDKRLQDLNKRGITSS